MDGHARSSGKTIAIGDSNCTTVVVIGSTSITLQAPQVVITDGGKGSTPQGVRLADGSVSTVLMSV
jgi:hypothetical protein